MNTLSERAAIINFFYYIKFLLSRNVKCFKNTKSRCLIINGVNTHLLDLLPWLSSFDRHKTRVGKTRVYNNIN